MEVGANTTINDPSYAGVVSVLVILKAQILAYREVFVAASLVTLIGAFVALSLRDYSKIKDEKVKPEVQFDGIV